MATVTHVIDIDAHKIGALKSAFVDLSAGEMERAYAAALNRTGDMTYTRVVKALAEQTGAANREVRKEVSKHRADAGTLTFTIKAHGGYWSLKRFKAKAAAKGVSASPWKVRRVFAGTFFGPGGHVYRRTSDERLPIKKLWGPAIPNEMLKGTTAQVAEQTVAEVLPGRLQHEADRAIARVKARYGL